MKNSPWGSKEGETSTKLQIVTDLARSAQQELDAIADYKARATSAGVAGDDATVKVYEHIIPQEEEHFREFTRRLRELGVEG